jgi:hydrogenase maturation protein HypF
MAVRGAVQGVGFRPFVYRLATELGLSGWVLNSSQGVFLEVEGPEGLLDSFLLRIDKEKPPRASIQSLEYSHLDTVGFTTFEIRTSDEAGTKTAFVMPDIATCPDCLADISNPSNRRYQYPFTNCTNCGPRFSIIRSLPYDRPNTTMREFHMCPACRSEYENPLDRRFHAQPNACPTCGPHVEFWDASGAMVSQKHDAISIAAEEIRNGRVVAVKGLGGFHLVVDARNEAAVATLRTRKHREEKPFALMFPALSDVKQECSVSELESRLVLSPESPIVLLRRRSSADQAHGESHVAPSVATRNPYLGVMLPYSPLHHLLLRELGFPVVATSGNVSDEPLCTDEYEARARLRGIADFFLIHNRPIYRHVDDSIARVILGRELVMRRARGYAPLPIPVPSELPDMLAVGPHLKNTVAVSRGKNVFVSQHIGDLETQQSYEAFQRETQSLQALYAINPVRVVSDLHPEYLSTKFAQRTGIPLAQIQHHWAHVASCMAENEVRAPLLGVSWDGTGFGTDETIWGGEFLVPDEGSFRRAGHLRTFMLPGSDTAIKEPRRAAAGILFELFGPDFIAQGDLAPIQAFRPHELAVVGQMLAKRVQAPVTSSAGRLFDAVSALIGLRQQCSFEGQAAMELEFLAEGEPEEQPYAFDVTSRVSDASEPFVLDWGPMIDGIISDLRHDAPRRRMASKFHNTLVAGIVRIAQMVGEERVILTGGCFQNKVLTERSVARLREAGFRPIWHQRVPPNDGGIALGQLYAASIMDHTQKEGGHVPGNSR